MRWILCALFAACAVPASAGENFLAPVTTACNDPDNPGRSPGPQFEMFYDIQMAPGNAQQPIKPLLGLRPNISARAWDTALTEPDKWSARLNTPAKYDQKHLRDIGGVIYYYEPDGRGGQRLCRTETWANRTKVAVKRSGGKFKVIQRGDDDKYGYGSGPVLDRPAQPDQTHNPVLDRLSKDYTIVSAARYRYDEPGHLVEMARFSDSNWRNGDSEPPDWDFYYANPVNCRLYHPDGKLWRYVDGLYRPERDCFKATRETANYFEYKYDANGKLIRSIQNLALPSKDRRWWQIWRMAVEGREVEAEVNGKVGIMHITGAVNRVAPKDNNALNADGGVYFFPNRDAPVSILDDFPRIYDYQRVRERGLGIVRMLEAFPAGSSKLTARLWLNTYNNTLMREEQYEDGKLIRVINTDRANDPTQDYYVEHLDNYKVVPENLVQRVYEYDDAGNEKLVAVSWTNVSKDEFYGSRTRSGGQLGPLVDMVKDIKQSWKDRDKPEKQKPERLEYYYGLPDGTIKWKDFEAFQKAFNIHENADWLYPKGPPKRF